MQLEFNWQGNSPKPTGNGDLTTPHGQQGLAEKLAKYVQELHPENSRHLFMLYQALTGGWACTIHNYHISYVNELNIKDVVRRLIDGMDGEDMEHLRRNLKTL